MTADQYLRYLTILNAQHSDLWRKYNDYRQIMQEQGRTPEPIDAWMRSQTGRYRYYQSYVADEIARGKKPEDVLSFHDWDVETLRAGAMNLGEYTARREAAERVKNEAYYDSPRFYTDVLKTISKSTDYRLQELAATTPDAKARFNAWRAGQIAEEMRRRLESSGLYKAVTIVPPSAETNWQQQNKAVKSDGTVKRIRVTQ